MLSPDELVTIRRRLAALRDELDPEMKWPRDAKGDFLPCDKRRLIAASIDAALLSAVDGMHALILEKGGSL